MFIESIMTFKKFVLQIILPVSFIISAIFVPIALNVDQHVAGFSEVLILSHDEFLVNKTPQTTFDEPEEIIDKFYAVNPSGELRNVTLKVYIYSIVIYAALIFLFLLIVFYIFYHIKKIKKV